MKLKSLAVLAVVLGVSLPAYAAQPSSGGTEGQSSSAPAPKHKKTARKPKAAKTVYKCPMDGYTSDKPGKCPNCGMALEKQPAPAKPSAK